MIQDNMLDKQDDAINPKHYTSHPSGIECIEISKHLSACLAQAFQYVWRCGQKDDPIQELKKALWFIDAELTITNFPSLNFHLIKDSISRIMDYESEHKGNALLHIAIARHHEVKHRNSCLAIAKHDIESLIAGYEKTGGDDGR